MYNEHVKYMYKSAGVGILGNAFKITTLSRKSCQQLHSERKTVVNGFNYSHAFGSL